MNNTEYVIYIILQNKRPSKHPLMSFHVLKDPKTGKRLYLKATNFFHVHNRKVSIPSYFLARQSAREFFSVMDKSVFSLWKAVYDSEDKRVITLIKKNP